MFGVFVITLALANPCQSGDIFRLDGDVTRDGDLAVFTQIEGMLGLKHSLGSSLITAIEKRGKVAVARRLGLLIMEHELRSSFEQHIQAARKPQKMARVLPKMILSHRYRLR